VRNDKALRVGAAVKGLMSHPPLTGDDAHRITMRRVIWQLLPFLILIYVVAWIDRANVGFAAAVYGFGAGILFLRYAAFEVPSNLILMLAITPESTVAQVRADDPRAVRLPLRCD
jgi:hypothetical protein